MKKGVGLEEGKEGKGGQRDEPAATAMRDGWMVGGQKNTFPLGFKFSS
jgi:hypothetical protein